MLLVETHLTNKYNFQIRGYTFYRTDHPDGIAHGGTGILIRERIVKNCFCCLLATRFVLLAQKIVCSSHQIYMT